jgi:hypothetical protein
LPIKPQTKNSKLQLLLRQSLSLLHDSPAGHSEQAFPPQPSLSKPQPPVQELGVQHVPLEHTPDAHGLPQSTVPPQLSEIDPHRFAGHVLGVRGVQQLPW